MFPVPPIATQNISSCWLLEIINSDNEMPPIFGQTTIHSPKVLDFFQRERKIGVRDEILKRKSTPEVLKMKKSDNKEDISGVLGQYMSYA